METLKILLLALFAINTAPDNKVARCGNEEILFSIDDERGDAMLDDTYLYTARGKFRYDEKAAKINDYTFDLFINNKLIGRYYYNSDFILNGADLQIEDKAVKKKTGFEALNLKRIGKDQLCTEVEKVAAKISSVQVLNNKAYFLMTQKYYDAALILLKKAIEKSPDYINAYLKIADCYWELGDKSEAIKNYKKYLELMKAQNQSADRIPKYVNDRVD